MPTPPSLIRPELKYGLLAGAGVSLWFYCEYLCGLHTTRITLGEQTGRFSSLILLFTILTLLKQQHAAFGPLFTLRRGVWCGLFTAAIAATVIYIFLAFYGRFINPGWIDAALNWKVIQLRAANISETEIQTYITFYRDANSPRGLLFSTLVNWTLQGGMMALLLTLWLNWRGKRAK